MQNKGRGKAAKVVNFVAKWLNLCLSTVLYLTELLIELNQMSNVFDLKIPPQISYDPL